MVTIEDLQREKIEKLESENREFRILIQDVLDDGRLYYYRKKQLAKIGFKVKLNEWSKERREKQEKRRKSGDKRK